jgi:hypothetical protein
LLKVCGFQETRKSIGRLAEKKEIKEAVVLLPHSYFLNTSYSVKYDYNGIKNYHIIIPVETINSLVDFDYKTTPYDEIKKILNTRYYNSKNTIVQQMLKMVNYNIPANLDWLRDTTLTPIVMYIFEFSHVLDQQDLADIWQGVMPKIATNHEEESTTIEHKLSANELMGNVPKDKLKQVFFSAFKVKKKAEKYYSNVTGLTLIGSQSAQTAAAIERLRVVSIQVAQSISIVKTSGNAQNQVLFI